MKIVCAEGSFLNDDNECEKRREKKPVAVRDRPQSRPAPEARQNVQRFQAPQARQATAGRPNGAGLGQRGQVLTGQERQVGCNSYGAIMSGVCP